MNIYRWLSALAALCVVLGCNRQSDSSGASTGDQGGSELGASSSPAPDNTGRNVRDRSDASLTPGDQGTSEADREMTQRLRKAINSNDQLSMDARNIKIITLNGEVTLRGPVKSAQELNTIKSIVQRAGVSSFNNQLEVKATNQ